MLVVLGLLGYAIWLWNSAYQRFGPAAALAWAAPWYLLAAVATAVFLLVSLYRLAMATRSITIYDAGLQVRLSPFRQVTLRWEEVTGLATGVIRDQFLGLTLRNRLVATLHLRKGRPLHLAGAWCDLPKAISIIKARLYPFLWPVLMAEFQSGRGASFGPLQVKPQAIYMSGRAISWDQVTRLSFQSGYLLVESSGKNLIRLPAIKIPNLELLMHLVDWGVNASTDSSTGKKLTL
jgi:hypothetical protein